MDDPKSMVALTLAESWTYRLAVLADNIAREGAAIALQVGGINLSQWRVLAAIADCEGRTASQVVALTPMDKGIVSRTVTSLIEQAYLRRVPSKNDGRLSHLYMTAKGQRLFEAVLAERQRRGVDGENLLQPDEKAEFLSQLNRLIAAYPREAHVGRTFGIDGSRD